MNGHIVRYAPSTLQLRDAETWTPTQVGPSPRTEPRKRGSCRGALLCLRRSPGLASPARASLRGPPPPGSPPPAPTGCTGSPRLPQPPPLPALPPAASTHPVLRVVAQLDFLAQTPRNLHGRKARMPGCGARAREPSLSGEAGGGAEQGKGRGLLAGLRARADVRPG